MKLLKFKFGGLNLWQAALFFLVVLTLFVLGSMFIEGRIEAMKTKKASVTPPAPTPTPENPLAPTPSPSPTTETPDGSNTSDGGGPIDEIAKRGLRG